MSNFFPATETDFNSWLENFWSVLGMKWQGWGISENDWASVDAAWKNWSANFVKISGDRATARAFAENAVISTANGLRGNSALAPADWTALGFAWVPTAADLGPGTPSLHLDWTSPAGVSISWNSITHPVWNWIELEWRWDGGQWEHLGKVTTAQTPFFHEVEDTRPIQYRGRWVASSDASGPWSPVGHALPKAA